MTQTNVDFREEVKQLLEVVMFENWLRFYFIKEEKGPQERNGGETIRLTLEMPDKTLEKIKELYPALFPLAKELNGRNIDFETSRNAVITYIMEVLDGNRMPQGEAQRVLGSVIFQTELQLFHSWVQIHEIQLDKGFADFGTWKKLFEQWRNSPAAKELAENIKVGLERDK